MILSMAKESISSLMAKGTKDSSKQELKKVRVNMSIKMVMFMMVCGIMISNKAMESTIITRNKKSIKENGLKMKGKEKENISIIMEIYTKVIGGKDLKKAKVPSNIILENFSPACLKLIKPMAKELCVMLMVIFMKACIEMVLETGLANIFRNLVMFTKAVGNKTTDQASVKLSIK